MWPPRGVKKALAVISQDNVESILALAHLHPVASHLGNPVLSKFGTSFIGQDMGEFETVRKTSVHISIQW